MRLGFPLGGKKAYYSLYIICNYIKAIKYLELSNYHSTNGQPILKKDNFLSTLFKLCSSLLCYLIFFWIFSIIWLSSMTDFFFSCTSTFFSLSCSFFLLIYCYIFYELWYWRWSSAWRIYFPMNFFIQASLNFWY